MGQSKIVYLLSTLKENDGTVKDCLFVVHTEESDGTVKDCLFVVHAEGKRRDNQR